MFLGGVVAEKRLFLSSGGSDEKWFALRNVGTSISRQAGGSKEKRYEVEGCEESKWDTRKKKFKAPAQFI